jgi:hypothetical protein
MLLLGCGRAAAPTAQPAPPSPEPSSPTAPPIATAANNLDPSPAAEPLPAGLVRIQVPEAAVETAQALLAAEHPHADYQRLAVQLLGADPAQLTPQAPAGAELKVNDRADFFINKNLGGDYQPIPARLRYISEHAAWWASITTRADDSLIQAAAKRFEEEVLPTNRLIFGAEPFPGIDGDRLIHILLVQEERWGGFFGYFSAMNQYPDTVRPFSNQKEMFVLNLGGARLDSLAFAGELAHEYQHLIHWNLDPNEDLWLNEAMGELATFLTGAPEPTSAIGKTNAELFAENPNIQLTSRPERTLGGEDQSAFAHYAAERLFAVYLLEQFGPQFVKDLIGNPDPGVASIQQELDRLSGSPRFSDVYASWILANLLDQPGLMQGQFGYQEIDPLPPAWEVINSFRGQTVAGRLPPYGARYYKIEADEPVEASFAGSTVALLTPQSPASGQYAWYSNRGDESEFSLTRTFDLTGLKTATLNYKVWYELEQYFDFAFVEVSTDGGNTWKVLETAHGTEQDPNDQSYGFAYTGTTIEWLSESLDLSPYAGQVIQIRFEVINDFTINRDGFQIDDIEIPELDYFDGAEDDAGGWEARGFIRSANLVPVEWIVWLVSAASPVDISWIELQPGQAAEFTIDGLGKDYPFAVVIVSPTAPVTTQELDFELIFRTP